MRATGHEVAFTGHECYLPPLASRGFRTFAADGGSGGPPPAGRLPLIEPSQQNEDRVIREYYRGEVPRRRAPGYAEFYARWRPDLVVRDEMDIGAAPHPGNTRGSPGPRSADWARSAAADRPGVARHCPRRPRRCEIPGTPGAAGSTRAR